MAGGRSHINQCTVSLEGLKSVPEEQGRVIARHVNGVVPGGCQQGQRGPPGGAWLVSKFLGSLAVPWILGCDANMGPHTSGLISWCTELGATIVAPTSTTCVLLVQVWNDAPASPHSPVEISLVGCR
eukprot:6688150-Pyramimonas_sp.AAC.1